MKIALFFTFAAISSAYAQVLSTGSCPDVSGIANFDVSGYTGVWYESSKYPAFFEVGSCITAEYTLEDDGATVDVVNSQRVLGLSNSVEGTAVLGSTDGSGTLSVTLNGVTSPLVVLDTDYLTYSIVYSCTNVGPLKAEFAWIMSRTRELTSDAATYVTEYLPTSPIDSSKLSTTDQSSCA